MSRVEGVGSVQLFGAKYAMRIWLDADKLNAYALTPADVIAAIQAQNAQISVGQLGDTPSVPGSSSMPPSPRSAGCTRRSSSATSSCAAIPTARLCACAMSRASSSGSANYGFDVKYNGKPASGLGVTLATGANALRTVCRRQGSAASACSRRFPHGLKAVIAFDIDTVRAQVDSTKWSRRCSKRSCWCSW